jgi:polycystin 1L2
VCGNAQKNDFNYLLEKETKYKLNDGHMWYSIISRPIYSSFTRTERLTCCFVLLYMSMLMNIMYYDLQSDDTNNTNDGIKIGLLNITPQQVNL